ncbi:MAG: hypothetical protein U1E78_05255 [Gammaproteobacteria bacterium]
MITIHEAVNRLSIILSQVLKTGQRNIEVPEDTFDGLQGHFFNSGQTNVHMYLSKSNGEGEPFVMCGLNETIVNSLIPSSEHFATLYSTAGQSLTCVIQKLQEQMEDTNEPELSNGAWVNPTTIAVATALTVTTIGAGLYYLRSKKNNNADEPQKEDVNQQRDEKKAKHKFY